MSLSSRSYISEDDSDSNSVVIKKETDVISPEMIIEPENHPEEDETPILPADFSEDFNVRFRSISSTEPSSVEETAKSKSVSMSTRLKNVWNRMSTDDGKPDVEKKPREKEEKVSKFSKLLPMGKTKKEVISESVDGNENDLTASTQENPVNPIPSSEENKEGGKKKWEIDQRKIESVTL